MAINVEVKKDAKDEKLDYPLLMGANNGLIVCMESFGRGKVVHATVHYNYGHEANDWAMGEFKPFNGTIELSNK